MLKRIGPMGLSAGLIVALTGASMAQTVQLLGDHGAWSSYTTETDDGTICFAMSEPTATTPEPTDYGEAHFYITHRPSEDVVSESNLIAGYDFAADTTATARIGGQNFALYTARDSAWLQDPAQSAAFVGAVRAGATMEITGTSAAGNEITQSFSLSGSSAATTSIDAAC